MKKIEGNERQGPIQQLIRKIRKEGENEDERKRILRRTHEVAEMEQYQKGKKEELEKRLN